jgi:hypothetical protein
VRHGSEALLAREREHRLVGLGREARLEAAEPDADDPAVPILGRVAHDLLGLVEWKAADDVRGQSHLDSV